MRQLLSIFIILSLLASCGIKRELMSPCQAAKKYKTNQSLINDQQQSNTEPCAVPKVDSKGNILLDNPPASPSAPATPAQNVPGIPGQR